LFNLVGKILLFALGQKLTEGSHAAEFPKNRIMPLICLGAVSLVFFVQGIAALLVAAYFAFTILLNLQSYYAALAVSAIALIVSGIFSSILKCKFSECTEKKTLIGGFNPVSLISAFANGFCKGQDRACRMEEDNTRWRRAR